jgi:hypothetical protein
MGSARIRSVDDPSSITTNYNSFAEKPISPQVLADGRCGGHDDDGGELSGEDVEVEREMRENGFS